MGDHDGLFKRVFSVPENAAQELRSVLPAGLIEGLDLSALALVAGSFVDPELRGRHTDLLFRAPRRDGDGSVYVYFLLEHQSAPDPRGCEATPPSVREAASGPPPRRD